jgi:hypothetical protein
MLMSDALINLSQAIDRMHRAGKLEDELTRFRKLEQAREEAAVYLRILEEQEADCELTASK